MRIVLDANIFISSVFWGGNPKVVLERVISNLDMLFITKEILNEIEDVIGRPKFHMGKDEIEYYIKSIEEIGRKIIPRNQVKKGSRDKTDNKYIECAIAANADYIITGDIHLLEIREYSNIKIVNPKEYLEIVTRAANTRISP